MDTEAVLDILENIKYKEWHFYLGAYSTRGPLYLQVQFTAPDLSTGKEEVQHGRKWVLSEYMVRSEIVQTAFMAVLAAEEHEARERFRYRGRAVFGPHFDVEALAELHAAGAIEVRASMEKV